MELLPDQCTVQQDVVWNGDDICQGSTQSELSFEEQKQVLKLARSKLDQYIRADKKTVRNLIVTGGPGTGKTTSGQITVVMAISRGLVVGITAIMSVRAKQLGGVHVSSLFCIPVNEYASPQRLAEMALMKLFRRPKLMAYLRQMDVLYFDELGLLSDKIMSTLDIIFRRIRDSSLFMGGVHWIASLDHLQMQAIGGRPVLMSPHILTCFDMFLLRQSVRASRDAPYRRLQDITRYSREAFTTDVIAEFCSILATNCNFVNSDANVAPHILRIFGKKVATRIAEERMLHSVRQQYEHVVITRPCKDVESTPEGNWVPASTASTNCLDREAKEPRLLHFFPRAIYEVTFNDPGGLYSQWQLALLTEMPSESDVDEFKPVRLLIAPNGCKTAPSDSHTADMLITDGWKYCLIPLTPDRPHNL